MMIKRIFTMFGALLYFGVSAQTTHTAVKGENMYSIAKEYGITVNDLLKLNPKLSEKQLQIGDILTVNPKGKSVIAKKENGKSQFGNVTLKSSQKVSEIAKQYNISENDLKLLNPDLDSQLKAGGKIVLPVENIVEYEVGVQKSWEKSMASAKEEAKKATKKPQNIHLAKIILNRSQIIQSITNYYNISEADLRELNPDLESKLKVEGEIVLPIENIKNTKESNLKF